MKTSNLISRGRGDVTAPFDFEAMALARVGGWGIDTLNIAEGITHPSPIGRRIISAPLVRAISNQNVRVRGVTHVIQKGNS